VVYEHGRAKGICKTPYRSVVNILRGQHFSLAIKLSNYKLLQSMTYTKKQRNEIYRKALEFLCDRFSESFAGICWCIIESCDGCPGDVLDEFPEFGLFKPDLNEDGIFWWRENDFASRETALLFMIAMTD
jgi:hypothetical protein